MNQDNESFLFLKPQQNDIKNNDILSQSGDHPLEHVEKVTI